MGRKKKSTQEAEEAPVKQRREEYFDSSEDEKPQSKYTIPLHDIDPDIQQLAYSFNLGGDLVQKLNDVMIEERKKTWKEDLEKLYDVLKEARTPAAILNIKIRDMESGRFIGKAKCVPKVLALAKKHFLDKGATGKLQDAMSIREAMGKDIDKDLAMLDEHLAASNKPSALVSTKLDALRKGYNIGHCIYSRETIVGGPNGVEGCFLDKKKRVPGSGMSDAALEARFDKKESVGGSGGKLMDEATIKKMMAAEKKKDLAKEARARDRSAEKKGRRSPSRGLSRERNSKRARSRSRRARSGSRSRRPRSRSRSRRRR